MNSKQTTLLIALAVVAIGIGIYVLFGLNTQNGEPVQSTTATANISGSQEATPQIPVIHKR